MKLSHNATLIKLKLALLPAQQRQVPLMVPATGNNRFMQIAKRLYASKRPYFCELLMTRGSIGCFIRKPYVAIQCNRC
jgi:hypothetical protein